MSDQVRMNSAARVVFDANLIAKIVRGFWAPSRCETARREAVSHADLFSAIARDAGTIACVRP